MDIGLFFHALIKFLLGAGITGLLLFLPAGDPRWVNGWAFMAMLFIPMFVAGIVLIIRDPGLLRSRLEGREKVDGQRTVIALSGLMFLSGFIIAGLGRRYGWYQVPDHVSAAASVIFLIAYSLYGEVLRENRWLSRTVKVQQGQIVVSSGLYGIVRHPMYSVTLFLFLSMPLMLGSLWSFLVFMIYPVLIVRRILSEEDVLMKELEGYWDYMTKVKWRLIPHIW